MSQIIVQKLIASFRYLVILALSAGTAVASEDVRCPTPRPSLDEFTISDGGTTWRGRGVHPGEAECFTVHLPSAGTLMLEVSVPGTARAEPKIDFLSERCDGPLDPQQSFRYRERYANRLELEIPEAGRYSTCVTAQDPEEILGDYKVAGAFRSEEYPGADGNVGGFENEEDPDEHEPDAGRNVTSPTPGHDTSHLHHRLCQRDDADDHGDTFRCATSIAFGQRVSAEIRNGWGDDQDLFTFFVEELTTVHIEVAGSTDLLAILYDRSGNRLSMGYDPGSEANSRITKTLSPGQYFLRVERRYGGEGAYRLTAEKLGWKD